MTYSKTEPTLNEPARGSHAVILAPHLLSSSCKVFELEIKALPSDVVMACANTSTFSCLSNPVPRAIL